MRELLALYQAKAQCRVLPRYTPSWGIMLLGSVFPHITVVIGFIHPQRKTYPSGVLSCQPPRVAIQCFVVTVPNLACWGIPGDPCFQCCVPSYVFLFLTRERILSCGSPAEAGGYLPSRLSFLECIQPNSQPRLCQMPLPGSNWMENPFLSPLGHWPPHALSLAVPRQWEWLYSEPRASSFHCRQQGIDAVLPISVLNWVT